MSYRLKRVSFRGRELKILLQNENGPCPLLAIANVLLLSDRLQINSDYAEISSESLIQLVANKLLEINATSEAAVIRVQSVINILPLLQFGLDVNVKFASSSSFEYTEQMDAFDALGIPVYHGWVVDEQDRQTASIVLPLSYNLLMNKLVEYRAAVEGESSISEEVRKKVLTEGPIIEAFLNDTASQLTYAGLMSLYDTIGDNTLAVFFRNNHFSTIYKNMGRLYLLVSDLGYEHEDRVVWELLDEIDGNTEYMDSYFQPTVQASQSVPTAPPLSHPHEVGTVAPPSKSAQPLLVDNDFLLAMQLQQRLNGETLPNPPPEEWKDEPVTPTVQSYTAKQTGLATEHGALLYQQSSTADEEQDRRTALALQREEEEAWRQQQDFVPVALSDRDLAYHRAQEEEYHRKHEAARRQASNGSSSKSSNCLIS